MPATTGRVKVIERFDFSERTEKNSSNLPSNTDVEKPIFLLANQQMELHLAGSSCHHH